MRARARTAIATTLVVPLLIGVFIASSVPSPAHAVTFSYSAADATTGITIDGAPATEGDSICALDSLIPASTSIETGGAPCATVATDGSWTLEIDTDNFDGSAFLVLASISFDSLSVLALYAAAVDSETSSTLLLTLLPRESEETGTVRFSAYVFGLVGPLSAQQVTFSFSGPGSPSNAIPVPTDDNGLASITVFAGALGTVDATATLTPNATLTLPYAVVETLTPDPLPVIRIGFSAWLGPNANASELVQNGQILWKWDGQFWISFVRTRSGLELGTDFNLALGDVLFLAQQA